MSNSTGSIKLTMTLPGPGGASVALSASLLPAFQSMSVGQIDVPDAEASATAHAIPFGSIAKATACLVRNKTGQRCTVKINGSAGLNDLGDGGWLLISQNELPGGGDLTALSLTTTDIQSGAGLIEFWVVGDPTP